MSAGPPTAGPLEPAAVTVLQCVAHHRLLTSEQVRQLRGPNASRRWTLALLANLERRGLLSNVRTQGRRKLWHATPAGAALAGSSGALPAPPRHLTGQEASGALQEHTLAVNDVGICFLRAARERGHELGRLAWRHEVAHPLRGARAHKRERVIADALLTYLLTEGDRLSLEYRLIELDRNTLTVDRLARKLSRYAELHKARDKQGQPTWRAWYPTFPAIHLILAGATRAALERRRRAVLVLCQADPQLADEPALSISICLLCDLQDHGPFTPIFLTIRSDSRPVDWLGQSAPRDDSSTG